MAKNVIIMIGDGMGWEMTRASAIQLVIEQQIEEYKAANPTATNQQIFDELFAGDTLQDDDYYTEGAGFGTSYQNLEGYVISTTGNTYIDGSKSNSALQGSPFNHNTGQAPIREGFEFSPDPALVEGFFEELRDQGFDEDAIFDEDGNIRGGNVPIFDLEKGGISPWDPDYYEERDNPDEAFDKEYIKNLYPDSAGTATGLYTGVKTYVGALAVDIFEETVETTAERALETGKSVGVVSSVPFNHATPAAAVAHVNQRNKLHDHSVEDRGGAERNEDGELIDEFGHVIEGGDNIFRQIVEETKPTVVLGGGHYLTRGGTEEEPDDRYITFEETENLRNGVYDYTFVERGPDAAQVLETTAASLDPEAGDRLMGVYGARGQGGNLPWRGANSDYSEAGTVRDEGRPRTERPLEDGETAEEFIAREVDENPTLQQLTEAALDVLEDDNEGFWMMVESGDIDWSAHDNDMDAMLGTLKDFDESVASVQDWIAENGGYEENLLIVTADHDHYLTLLDNFPEKVAQTLLLGDGGLELTMNDDPVEAGHFWGSDETVKYGWGTHTSRPVPVYFQGPEDDAAFLEGFLGEGYEAYGTEVEGVGTYIDQVHLGLTQLSALSEGLSTVSLTSSPDMVAEGSQLTWDFALTTAAPTGGLVIELELTEDTDPLPGDIQYNVAGSENITGFELITLNGVIQGAEITIAEGATTAKMVSDILDDMTTEGPESVTFTLLDGEGYLADSTANEASFTIEDTSITPLPTMVRGSSGEDFFDTEDPGESGFMGDNQLLFAGGGDDFVDVSFAAGGDRSRLDLGSGDDIIFAGTNNRIIAGSGDDMLFLGYGEGDNVVTGGSGMDQFWLTNDDVDVPTEANIITDFTIGEDVIGFGATDLSFDDLTLTQNGLDTTINGLGQDLAILRRVESSELSASDFVFA